MNENPEPKSGCLQLGSSLWAIFVAGIIILFMAAIAGPKLIESRLPGNESSAIGTLRFFHSSQKLYKEQGHPNYANLKELEREAMKGHMPENDVRQGYRFTCQAATSKPSEAWWATAEPVERGVTGQRFFATNHTGAIYFSFSQPVKPNPETGEITASEEVLRLGSR